MMVIISIRSDASSEQTSLHLSTDYLFGRRSESKRLL